MASKFIDKDYLLRCSEKTLQTNEKGFFLQFADHVAEVAGSNWIKNVFGKLQTDKERIRIIYQYKPVKDVVCETLSHVQEIYRKKNAELSQKRRLESEKLLTKGEEPHKALVLSCQSVLRAPEIGENPKVDDGFSLPVAYWNRANILIHLKKYSWALLDVQEALKDNLLDHLKSEAFIKMGVCYKGMGENGRAKIAFGLAERLLEGDEKNLKLIKEYQGRKFTEDKEIDRRVLPKVAGDQHKIYSSASNKINIEEEEGKGRFIAAKEDVQTGDTIIVEEPLVACLLPDNFSTHCHNCLERLVSPVGCKECSSIAFCKIECRDKALSTYHKYECHFSDLLIGSGMSILCHAVLRLITQSTLKECKQMYKNRTKENIFSLCSNSQLRPPEDFLQRTLMAAFLLRCLQKSSYFDDGEANEDVIPNEEEFCVGELLLLYLQVLQFNAHEIYETKCEPEHRFRNSKTVYVGVALYPTAALFNHDCYPSVTRHFVGKKIILTAIRPVKPGEPISENYGPNFTRKTLAERQRSLSSRYWFQCKCFACTQDWPTYDKGLQKLSKRLRCPTSNCTNIFTLPITKEYLKCPRCRKDISLTNHVLEMRTLEQQYEAATNAMEVGDSTKAISLLCQAIDSYHRISYAPHYDTHIGQEIFRACLADTGNTYVSKFFK